MCTVKCSPTHATYLLLLIKTWKWQKNRKLEINHSLVISLNQLVCVACMDFYFLLVQNVFFCVLEVVQNIESRLPNSY
jgi:hypothetical protein